MSATLRPSMVAWCAMLIVVGALFFVDDALACAVCQDAQEKNRGMFVATTWLLSLLPLGMIGGIVFVLVRRAREEEREIDETIRAASQRDDEQV